MERNAGAAFARNLSYLRERKKISRRALSELCGLSKNMVSIYESGRAEPRLSALSALADALDVTTDKLLGRD